MKRFGSKATIATVMLGIAISCTQAKQQGDQHSKQGPKPYTVQRDVLGESLDSFVANNPSCKPRAGSSLDSTKSAIEGAQTCTVALTTYAGMPLIARTANFYQGGLFDVFLEAPTSECKKSDLLGSLKEKFGEPKTTETVDGKEITPYHFPGSPEFKFWQNGVSTISFQESMGTLDACTTDFYLDTVYWKVSRLEQEEKEKEERAKKKDM